jgi:hypothetical protein
MDKQEQENHLSRAYSTLSSMPSKNRNDPIHSDNTISTCTHPADHRFSCMHLASENDRQGQKANKKRRLQVKQAKKKNMYGCNQEGEEPDGTAKEMKKGIESLRSASTRMRHLLSNVEILRATLCDEHSIVDTVPYCVLVCMIRHVGLLHRVHSACAV